MTKEILLALAAVVAVATTVAVWRTGARRHDPRAWLYVALRGITIILIVTAFGEPYLRAVRAQMSVVFVLDVSQSIDPSSASKSRDHLAALVEAMPPKSEVALVAFAARATTVLGLRPPADLVRHVLNLPDIDESLNRSGTAIAGALALAADLLPPAGDRRIVLVTDGGETAGDAARLIPRLRAENVLVAVVPTNGPTAEDTRLRELRMPPRARRGTPLNAELVVDTNHETDAIVTLSVDGIQAAERSVRLRPGRQVVSVPISLPTVGDAVVSAQISAPMDAERRNDRAVTHVRVEGPLRGLYVRTQQDNPTAAERALQRLDGVDWKTTSPMELPASVERLRATDVLVFDDVSARQLSQSQMQAVESYVRDLGGGWLIIGGPNTYGAGEWQGTPLESAAPVEMIPQEKRKPLALALVVDKSGSMAHETGGMRKLTLAAMATRASLDALEDDDRLVIIAFDARPKLAVAPSPKSQRAEILQAVEALRPGSGTAIVPALQLANDTLAQLDLPRKHIILLSDGQSDGDLVGVARALADGGVSVSAIAVGGDARPILQEIANAGNGSFHTLTSAAALPTVIAREARQKGEFIVQEATPVESVLSSPMTTRGPSHIDGYIGTTAKSAATVFLRTQERDPILVGWRHGLGRSLAFMSDGGNRWARDWATHENFTAQMETWLRWTTPQMTSDAFDLLVSVRGTELEVRADFPPEGLPFVSDLQAIVRGPAGDVHALSLSRDDVGYVGRDPLVAPGSYDVSVLMPSGAAASRRVEFLDNAEFVTDMDHRLLRELASATGGSVLPDPHTWAKPRAGGIPLERQLSAILLLAALTLVLLEWTVRQWRWSNARSIRWVPRPHLAPLTAAKRDASPVDQGPRGRGPSPPVHIPSTVETHEPSLARLRAAKARARV